MPQPKFPWGKVQFDGYDVLVVAFVVTLLAMYLGPSVLLLWLFAIIVYKVATRG